jgi:hypothetical protein
MNTNQKQALQLLATLRANARRLWLNKVTVEGHVSSLTEARDLARKAGNRVLEAEMQTALDDALELKLSIHFQRLQLGIMFVQQAPSIAEVLPREVWLEALSVNRRHWDSDDMREYGKDPCKVVGVLKLENSESEDTPENRPLHGCFDLAVFNKIKTDPRLAKTAHELADGVFGGAISARFGEWKEPTTLQRLGGV